MGFGRAVALLLLGTALVHATGLTGPFQFDDAGVILRDPAVHDLHAALATPGLRPLLRLSYALCWATHLGPVAFHAFNVAVHLVNVALVAALARRATGDDAGALLAALLFALHPVHTEAVTYVSGRSVALATTCSLLTLLAFAGPPTLGRSLAGTAAFVAAVLTKETAATLPLGVWGWQLTVGGASAGRALRRTASLAVAWVVLAVAAIGHDPTYRLLQGVVGSRPLGEALARQAEGLAWATSHLVRVDRLCIDPGLGFRPPDPAWAVAGAGLVVLLALVAGWTRRSRPAVAFGLGWFLLQAFVPYVLLPRTDVLNERHLYLADVGLFLAAGAAAAPVLATVAASRLRWTGGLLAVGLGAATVARNQDYRSELDLWKQTTRVAPGNPRAWHNLGVALEHRGRTPEALAAYVHALQLEPRLTATRTRLGRLAAGADAGEVAAP